MTEQVRKDIENRLETTFPIRSSLENISDPHRLCIIGETLQYTSQSGAGLRLLESRGASKIIFIFIILASLLHAYDSSWQVESFPSLIGISKTGNDAETAAQGTNNVKKDMASLRHWLERCDVGYLLPNSGSNLVEPRKLTNLCAVLMDKIQQRHGSKLKPLVSKLFI